MRKLLLLLLFPIFCFGQTKIDVSQVGGATANGVSFINSSNTMAQDATFLYNPTTHSLTFNAVSDPSKTIVWLGDSIVLGTGLTAGIPFSTQVCKALGYTEDNRAVTGTTAHSANQSLIPTYSSSTYGFLVIGYGTNDLNTLGSSASTFASDMTTFINACTAKGWPASSIYVISMYGFQYPLNNTNNLLYNTALQTVCTNTSTNYVDVYTPFTTSLYGNYQNNSLTQDGIHPNVYGSTGLFKIVSPLIAQKFNITSQSIVASSPIEGTAIKLRNYGNQSVSALVGQRPDGTLAPLMGLPSGTRALGRLFMRYNVFQDGAYVQNSADTTKDAIYTMDTKLWSIGNASQLSANLQLFNSGDGSTTLTNYFSTGLFKTVINGSTTFSTDYTGLTTIFGELRLNATSNYLNQQVSSTGYGRLQLFDPSGFTNLRNAWNTGKIKIFMSSGVTGTQVQYGQMEATGQFMLQNGGTYTSNGSRLQVAGTQTLTQVFSGVVGTDSLMVHKSTGGIAVIDPALLIRTISRSSAGTLALNYTQDYVFTGTTTTWTLPAISATLKGGTYQITIKNQGSGNITLNSNAGGNDIYTTSAVNTTTITPGSAATLINDGTTFGYH